MTRFKCVPIPIETMERFRGTGMDDRGNVPRRVVSDGSGAPCRHRPRNARAGEVMLLGSYNATPGCPLCRVERI